MKSKEPSKENSMYSVLAITCNVTNITNIRLFYTADIFKQFFTVFFSADYLQKIHLAIKCTSTIAELNHEY
jgi:hypothetical protein